MDAMRSMVSRILRMFAVQPASDERSPRERADDRRDDTDRESERRRADPAEAFFWSWQFPAQW